MSSKYYKLFFFLYFFLCVHQLCGCSTPSSGGQDVSPTRVIALTPSLTETLYALGVGETLIATSAFTSYPPQALSLTRLGGSLPLDAEVLLAQKPSFVFMHPSDGKLAQNLAIAGIPSKMYAMDTISGVREAFLGVSSDLGISRRGEELWATTLESLRLVQSRWVTSGVRKRVLLVVDGFQIPNAPLYVAQGHAYLAELAQMCGAIVLSNGERDWSTMSLERVLTLNPDVILHFVEPKADIASLSAIWNQTFPQVQALQDNSLHFMQDPQFTIPGPRIATTLEAMCEKIYSSP